jgi:hypothetical protein
MALNGECRKARVPGIGPVVTLVPGGTGSSWPARCQRCTGPDPGCPTDRLNGSCSAYRVVLVRLYFDYIGRPTGPLETDILVLIDF